VGVVIAHARELIRDLRHLGVHPRVRSGELRVEDPTHKLTAAMCQKLTYFKDALIELLLEEQYEQSAAPTAPGLPDADKREAAFDGNLRVQVRPAGSDRWMIWFTHGASWRRRSDFATPCLDHARRTAEHWYGPPLDGWHAPEGDPR
jgi:hypothetical protein